MKRILYVVLTLTLIFVTASCAKAADSGKVDIRGRITNVTTDDNKRVTSILVEGKLESDTTQDKASVRIDKATKIYAADGKKISADELKEGLLVEVAFEGPVAESYPVQAKAKTVKLLE